MHDAAEHWQSAAEMGEMERRRELHGFEREKVAAAVEQWSGRRASPSQERDFYATPSEPTLRRVSMPPAPAQPRHAPEAENDAEALLADLTSPSQLRRRGAKSALRWMAEEEGVSFDTYDETVAAAAEWEAATEVAVSLGMQDVLDRLGLGRYSAGLARMGVATLADVGKRTPAALIKVAGLQPRECQSLLMELLSGCGARVARTELTPGRPAWERTSQPMWDSPPRLGPDDPVARAGSRIAKASIAKGKAATLKAQAREEELTEKWFKERAGMKKQISNLEKQISNLEKQLAALRKALDQQIRDAPEDGLPSPVVVVAAPTKQADGGAAGNGQSRSSGPKEAAAEQRKERLRSKILKEEIAELEARVEEWEKKERVWKQESRQLRQAAGKGAGVSRGGSGAPRKGGTDEAAWKGKEAKWKQDKATMGKTIEELREALKDAERPVTHQLDLSSASAGTATARVRDEVASVGGADTGASPRTALRSLLMAVPLLQHLSDDELSDVTEAVVVEEFDPLVDIITEGDAGDAMYFLTGGAAQAFVDDATRLVCVYSHGEFFGELALLMDQPRTATVRAGPAGARCLVLNRESFEKYCGSNPAVFAERQERYDTMEHEAKALLKSLDSRLTHFGVESG